MLQTKESNKRAPGRVVIYIWVHLALIYTLAFSNVLLVLALNVMVHRSRYCKCSLVCVKWEHFVYFQSEHIPSKWENTHSDMQILTEIKKSHYNINVKLFHIFWRNHSPSRSYILLTDNQTICIKFTSAEDKEWFLWNGRSVVHQFKTLFEVQIYVPSNCLSWQTYEELKTDRQEQKNVKKWW